MQCNEILENENKLSNNINLSNLELTTLSNQESYLAFYHNINLSNNSLKNYLYNLHTLQECVELDLSNNGITSLKTFPTLRNLKTLLLSNNNITDLEEIYIIIKKHSLIKLDVEGNSINKDLLISHVKNNHESLILIV